MVSISKFVLSSGSPLDPFRLSGGLACWFLFGLSSASFGLYWFLVSSGQLDLSSFCCFVVLASSRVPVYLYYSRVYYTLNGPNFK